MYGMVNHGIEQLVTEAYGPEVWRDVCAAAGTSDASFEPMLSYDDAVTYRLVGAIAERVGIAPEEVLESFGRYWIGYTQHTAIGRLLKFGGDSFLDCLASLDEMHGRIRLAMPDLRPPLFEIESTAEDRYRLHYRSPREGLAPMAIGLLYGLAADFGTRIAVEHAERRADGAAWDVFEITMLGPVDEVAAALEGAESGSGDEDARHPPAAPAMCHASARA